MKTIELGLVPSPQKYTVGNDFVELRSCLTIGADTQATAYGKMLCQYLQDYTSITTDLGTEGFARCEWTNQYLFSQKAESYHLEISSQWLLLQANSDAGFFYGLQTLRALLMSHGQHLPACTIDDYPRFSWRGFMLDTARQFYSVEFIKKMLDVASLHKLNRFHWHFTDDQGWRCAISAFPELTEKGAFRRDVRYPPDHRIGGFYTHAEMREVIAYAKARHIIVVPEIEIPGHASAFLSAFPQLGCANVPFSVPSNFGVHEAVMCVGNDDLLPVLQTILQEVAQIFPGPYIHIGGDEAPRTLWKTCPKCQKRIRTENLGDENGLQAWITAKVCTMVKDLGKIPIGWDEVLDCANQVLPQELIVQSWRGMKGGIKAGTLGHRVIMSPTEHCYLDYRASNSIDEPGNIGILTLEQAYAFTPTPPELPTKYHDAVIGGQGNLWTEIVYASKIAEYMLYPRLCAIAEALWLEQEAKNFADFQARLHTHSSRLTELGVLHNIPH